MNSPTIKLISTRKVMDITGLSRYDIDCLAKAGALDWVRINPKGHRKWFSNDVETLVKRILSKETRSRKAQNTIYEQIQDKAKAKQKAKNKEYWDANRTELNRKRRERYERTKK